MSKYQTKDLLKYLQFFSDEKKDPIFCLKEFVWNLYHKANELIYGNYNALALAWSSTDKLQHTFCSVAIGWTGKNIHFGFYRGSVLSDTKKILLGNGKQ